MFKKKEAPKVSNDPNLQFFTIFSERGCPWCFQGGPVIKYEPEQFKVQCWNCLRIFDKGEVYLDRTIHRGWIDKKIREAQSNPVVSSDVVA